MSKELRTSLDGADVTEEMEEKSSSSSFEAEGGSTGPKQINMRALFGDSDSDDDSDDDSDEASLGGILVSAEDDDKFWDYEAWERENEEKRIKQERLERFIRMHPLRRQKYGPYELHQPNLPLQTGFEAGDNIQARIAGAYDGRLSKEDIATLQIERLPCSASEFFQPQRPTDGGTETDHKVYHGWATPIRTVLAGTRSNKKIKTIGPSSSSSLAMFSCPLSLLRGCETTLVRHIFSYLRSPYDHVRFTIPAALIGVGLGNLLRFVEGRTSPEWRKRKMEYRVNLTSSIPPSVAPSAALSTPKEVSPQGGKKEETSNTKSAINDAYVAFSKVGNVSQLFPTPTDRNVNMMPFILGDMDSLPDYLQCYYPLVDACPWVREEQGNVAYLTVQETARVEEGETQRRPGLHIESPGVFADSSFLPCSEHPWGMGYFGYSCPPYNFDHYEGGMYIASNVDNSTILFDALVDRSVPGMVDRHGGCEYLRPIFPETKATKLKAGELVWMTDCTVHEAVPQIQACPRTFFRLVMPSVSHWYADHSTPNPKVPVPDGVFVIEGSKFATVVEKT